MLADIILICHFLFVAFIVGGLLAIVYGVFRHWRWIRNFHFRLIHILALSFVTLESLLGILCPLTVWENALRQSSGTYATSFMRYWIHRILFYDLPEKFFTLIYSLVTLAVIVMWFKVNPEKQAKQG
jgi:hypothetical protein